MESYANPEGNEPSKGEIGQHRQDLWDQTLLSGWITESRMPTSLKAYMMGCGLQDNFPSLYDLLRWMRPLKRAPRDIGECLMPTRAFMALALPTTSRWLWAGLRGDRVLKHLSAESRVHAKVAHKRHASVADARYRMKREADLVFRKRSILAEKLDGIYHCESDWKKVK
jgi:hypothetical protein